MSTPPTTNANNSGKLTREFFGLFFIFSSVLLLFSLFTYDPADPSLNHVVRGTVKVNNLAGMFGAYLSGLFVDFFGFGAYAAVAFLACLGIKRTLNLPEWQWWRWLSFFSTACSLCVGGAAWGLGLANVRGGGLLGTALLAFFLRYFNPWGTAFIWGFVFLLSLQMLFNISWTRLAQRLLQSVGSQVRGGISDFARRQKELAEQKKNEKANAAPLTLAESPPRKVSSGSALPAASSSGAYAQGHSKPKQAENAADLSPPVLSRETPLETFRETFGSASPPHDADTRPNRLPIWEKLSLKPENPDDEDLPPWVKDLEAGRIGVPTLKPKAAPEPVAAPEISDARPSGQSAGKTTVDTPPAGSFRAEAQAEIIIDEAPQPIPAVEQDRGSLSFISGRPLKLPGVNLLSNPSAPKNVTSRAELEAKGRALVSCLQDFSIQAELVRITPGPVVTMFELRPAPGVKVSRIAGLSDDIALNLKSIAVRVQAPIPGTDTVGVEIPNDVRETVSLKELFSSAAFQASESLLSMGLGKDISGGPAVADLARMPHLLVAGATGAGKSVCLNSILLSFLYKARPDEVKLLLIDPKRIEMAVYSDLPHLIHPVVTEMSMAKNALDWAVSEMDRRYSDIARLGVRNVAAYNDKLAELRGKDGVVPDSVKGLEPMPYLVIVIDELADLMLTAAKEVETSIVRLAQLARAAGIHLILATQRPSVDVVTGLIKANFPCRISFQVTSKHDSRTILDTVGAENLLGKGDMLFKPAGGRFQRMHGAFVSDDDVYAVVNYWKKQQAPNYRVDFSEWGSDGQGEGGQALGGGSELGADPMYAEALEFVMQQGQASISLIQRRFRIGFNRAARFVEQMERDGIIGQADAGKPRKVIR